MNVKFLKCFKSGFSPECLSQVKKQFKKGLTLIELLVVIAVLGLLATGVMAVLNPVEQIKKGNDSNRKASLNQIQKGLENYYNDNGRYPSNSSNYKIIDDSKEVAPGTKWAEYMSKFPSDPTGKDYVYFSPDGQSYYLYASLDRKNDPQACSKNDPCDSLKTPGFPPSDSCKGTCNYGVSSPNVSVNEASTTPPSTLPTSPTTPSDTPIPTTPPIPTDTPAPTNTPAPTPTNTPVPTAAPPTPTRTPTPVLPTATSVPPTPTRTPTPVPPTPTRTPTPVPPTPTRTPTPIPPTPTRTPTPVPPTATVVPPTPTRTPTPVPPTPTRTPTPVPPTATPVPVGVVFESKAQKSGSLGTSSSSWSHTIGTNSKRLLVVSLVDEHRVSSLNYAGQALTKLYTLPYGSFGFALEMWYLKNPPSGTANITVNFTSANSFIAGSSSYYNVNQTTPFGTPVTKTGYSAAPTLSVPSSATEIVTDMISNEGGNNSMLAGSGQSTITSVSLGSCCMDGFASYKAGSSSTGLSYTFTYYAEYYGWLAVSIKP